MYNSGLNVAYALEQLKLKQNGDRRVRRTHKLLGEALVRLLRERPFSKISVRDITQTADVAYSTFFRNFESKEELLLTYLCGAIFEVRAVMQRATDEPPLLQARETMRLLFVQIRDDAEIYRSLFHTPAAQPVLDAFQGELVRMNKQMISTLPTLPTPPVPLTLLVEGAMAQLMALIGWWVNEGCKTAVVALVDYYEVMILRPFYQLLFGDAAQDKLTIA